VRPAYHFTPRANWLSDPNGLVHDGQSWHMFYQYNPQGEEWGHMSWGHATSSDLVDWRELEPALLDDARHMVFSGSAVIDRCDSSGFGRDAMVAVYTAALAGPPPRQTQELAYSLDRGRSWTRYPGNPVLDAGLADFRDPYVFWHDPSASWIMAVVKSNEQLAQIYRSDDLVTWRLASEIGGAAAPGRIWECPTLVELPLCGTAQRRWLFKVDALHEAPGAGALYLTGHFDGFRFTPDDGLWRVVDHGRDFYAAVAWNGPSDQAGRPAWIGWMGNHAYQGKFPLRGWRGVMSVPRRIGLIERTGGLRLSQQVEPAVAGLFGDFAPLGEARGTIPFAARVELNGEFSGELTLADGRGSTFTAQSSGDSWLLRRNDASLGFLEVEARLEREDGEGLSLWLDGETIEAIAPDGTRCASFQHRPAGERLIVETDQRQKISVATLA